MNLKTTLSIMGVYDVNSEKRETLTLWRNWNLELAVTVYFYVDSSIAIYCPLWNTLRNCFWHLISRYLYLPLLMFVY